MRAKIAILVILALLVATGGLALRARAKRHEEERYRARAAVRDTYAAAAARTDHPRDAALAALRAIAIDHELREPPDADRIGIFAAAYAASAIGAPELVRLVTPGDAPEAPAFTRAGDLAIVDAEGVTTFDVETGRPLHRFGAALAGASIYGSRALGVTKSGDVVAWDAKTEARLGERRLGTSSADVVLARDAPFALGCGSEGCIVVDGDLHEVMKLTPKGAAAKVIAPDGKRVAVAGTDGAWTVVDAEARATIPSDAAPPRAVFASKNLLVARAGSVGLYDPAGKEIATIPGQLDDVSEDGAFVRTTRGCYRTSTGEERGALPAAGTLRALTPNGRVEAIADGREVTLRSTDGREVMTLSGHEGTITAMSWSGDGNFLATTGDDRTLRLWDVWPEPRAMAILGLEETPAVMHLSRDARHVMTSDPSHRLVRLYDLSLDRAIAALCRVAPPNDAVDAVCR